MHIKEKITRPIKTISEQDIGNIYKVSDCDVEDGDYAIIDVDKNKKLLYEIYKNKTTLTDGDIKGDLIYTPPNERLGILLEGYITYYESLMQKTSYDGDLAADLEAAENKIKIIKYMQTQLTNGEL